MDQFSQKELKELKELFGIFDKDGDGRITAEEIGTVMRSLGYEPTNDQLDLMIADVDVDGNGTVEFDEFVSMMAKKKRAQKKRQEISVTDLFNEFDVDGDGFITAQELQTVLNKLGLQMSKDDIRQMMKEADSNGDGVISFEEFQNVMGSL